MNSFTAMPTPTGDSNGKKWVDINMVYIDEQGFEHICKTNIEKSEAEKWPRVPSYNSSCNTGNYVDHNIPPPKLVEVSDTGENGHHYKNSMESDSMWPQH